MSTNSNFARRCAALEKKNAELEAEVERTRWHYPDRGELPKDKEDILTEGHQKNDWWTGEYLESDEKDFCEFVTRWRYV